MNIPYKHADGGQAILVPAAQVFSLVLARHGGNLDEVAEEIGKEPCLRYVYKKPEDIPERFYKRLGKKRPQND